MRETDNCPNFLPYGKTLSHMYVEKTLSTKMVQNVLIRPEIEVLNIIGVQSLDGCAHATLEIRVSQRAPFLKAKM